MSHDISLGRFSQKEGILASSEMRDFFTVQFLLFLNGKGGLQGLVIVYETENLGLGVQMH
jgi:hypothetical protein